MDISNMTSVFFEKGVEVFRVDYNDTSFSTEQIIEGGVSCGLALLNETVSGVFESIRESFCSNEGLLSLFGKNTTEVDSNCMISTLEKMCESQNKVPFRAEDVLIPVGGAIGFLMTLCLVGCVCGRIIRGEHLRGGGQQGEVLLQAPDEGIGVIGNEEFALQKEQADASAKKAKWKFVAYQVFCCFTCCIRMPISKCFDCCAKDGNEREKYRAIDRISTRIALWPLPSAERELEKRKRIAAYFREFQALREEHAAISEPLAGIGDLGRIAHEQAIDQNRVRRLVRLSNEENLPWPEQFRDLLAALPEEGGVVPVQDNSRLWYDTEKMWGDPAERSGFERPSGSVFPEGTLWP